ncbi:MAG: DoxX family protein [Kofleriaceae bacterium]
MTRYENAAYAALRIVAGFLFLFHGVQKVLGYFTARPQPEVLSQMWIGGMIELVGGAMIALGLLTRPAAFVSAGTMAVAYFQFHWKLQGGEQILPIANGGEMAALYCFVFLFIFVKGAGVASLDGVLRRS